MNKLGENISREWSEETHATELWDALQLIASDASAGLKNFVQLAEAGSGLSKMYLGDILLRGKYGVPKNRQLGECWLRRAAEVGSVEGTYILAWHLMDTGRANEAVAQYHRLADLKYSPALYALGWYHYKGPAAQKNLEEAMAYLKCAEDQGHLYASRLLSHILMRKRLSPLSWVRGFIKKIVKTVPFVTTYASYPSSDRLRK